MIIVIAVVVALIGVVGAAYVFDLIIPGNVTVGETPEGDFEVQAFTDAACSIPFTNVDWGTLQPGEDKRINFYLKNTGSNTITSIMVEVISDVQNAGPMLVGELEPQQTTYAEAILVIKPTANSGQFSANIQIQCIA